MRNECYLVTDLADISQFGTVIGALGHFEIVRRNNAYFKKKFAIFEASYIFIFRSQVNILAGIGD